MATSGNSDAVLLLTAHLSGSDDSGAKPLTTEEWWAFANWLKERNATLEYLLENVDEVLGGRSDPRGTTERIKRLLDRGSALGLAKDRWAQAGLWWLTSADDDYPVRLKKRLGQASPAVLYGCGCRTLLALWAIEESRSSVLERPRSAIFLGLRRSARLWLVPVTPSYRAERRGLTKPRCSGHWTGKALLSAFLRTACYARRQVRCTDPICGLRIWCWSRHLTPKQALPSAEPCKGISTSTACPTER